MGGRITWAYGGWTIKFPAHAYASPHSQPESFSLGFSGKPLIQVSTSFFYWTFDERGGNGEAKAQPQNRCYRIPKYVPSLASLERSVNFTPPRPALLLITGSTSRYAYTCRCIATPAQSPEYILQNRASPVRGSFYKLRKSHS